MVAQVEVATERSPDTWIFVDSIATIISMMNGTAISLVIKPVAATPPNDLKPAVSSCSEMGNGNPSFVKRPHPDSEDEFHDAFP